MQPLNVSGAITHAPAPNQPSIVGATSCRFISKPKNSLPYVEATSCHFIVTAGRHCGYQAPSPRPVIPESRT